MNISTFAKALNDKLQIAEFTDYCPNGLQVQGERELRRVAFGVSANQGLFDQAIEWNADAIVVHHGFFWSKENPTIVGLKYKRIRTLISAGIHLLGYHLPLDASADVGNNVGVLRALGAEPTSRFGGKPAIGWIGELPEHTKITEIAERCEREVGRGVAFLHGASSVRRIAVVTGGGAGFLEEALEAGAELFITGEPSEQSQGLCRELGANMIAAGHHHTERFGPRLLAEWAARTLQLETTFIDVPNPV